MTSFLSPLIFSLFLLPSFPLHAHGMFASCSLSNYTNGSPFESNLNRLLSILPRKAAQYEGFYNGSFGTGTTRVFGLAMCYADSNSSACTNCLTEASSSIIKVCAISTTADIMYESCVLRYSERDFDHSELISMSSCVPHITDVQPDPLTDLKKFKNALLQLMHNLTVNASLSSLKLATGVSEYTSKQTIYGLVQCARGLEPDRCGKCIDETLAFVGNCSDRTVRGAGVKTPSCYMRYEFHPFYVISQAGPPWKTNGGGKLEMTDEKLSFILVFFMAALLHL